MTLRLVKLAPTASTAVGYSFVSSLSIHGEQTPNRPPSARGIAERTSPASPSLLPVSFLVIDQILHKVCVWATAALTTATTRRRRPTNRDRNTLCTFY